MPVKEMNAKQLLDRLPAMQMLMERVLGCRPAGAAKTNRLVQVALYLVVKESIQLHKDLCDGMTVLLDAFFDMEQLDRVRAFDLYYRYAKQSEELEDFFKICKQYGVGRSSEYIAVELVPKERLETLEEFLRSNAPSGRSKSPEPQPLQLEYKPQTPEREPEPVARPVTPEPAPPPEVIPEEAPTVPEPEPEPEEGMDFEPFHRSCTLCTVFHLNRRHRSRMVCLICECDPSFGRCCSTICSLCCLCATSKESLNHSGHFFFLNVVWIKCVTMKNTGTVIFYEPVCKYSIHHSDVLGIVWFVLVCEHIAFSSLCYLFLM